MNILQVAEVWFSIVVVWVLGCVAIGMLLTRRVK